MSIKMVNPQEVLTRIAASMSNSITSEIYTRIKAFPMLAHYTNFEAMRSILSSKEFWFHSVSAAKDISEVHEGAQIVKSALLEFGPHLFKKIPFGKMLIQQQYDQILAPLSKDIYAISLCEHGSDEETDRLSMWREYGHDGHGVCMVLRKETLLGQKANGLFPVAWCPMEYDTPDVLKERVRSRIEEIEQVFISETSLYAIPTDLLGRFVINCALSLVLSHKNRAYRDEREIRFIQSNTFRNIPAPKDGGHRKVNINQQSKTIFALPLRKYEEYPIDASIHSLVDHVIIGPSDQQETLFEKTRALLKSCDLENVGIRLSDIPYRSTKRS